MTVTVTKVRSRTGKPISFHSALFPPYVRMTKSLEATLPWLYLKGTSSGAISAVLNVFIDPEAKGLSANTLSRLKQTWSKEYEDWRSAKGREKDDSICI